MSKRNAPVVVELGDYLAKKSEEGKIIVKVDGVDDDFVIPAPIEWSDDVIAAEGDPVAQARALLGSDEYDRFLEAGGSAMAVQALVQDYSGMRPPE